MEISTTTFNEKPFVSTQDFITALDGRSNALQGQRIRNPVLGRPDSNNWEEPW
jgi:hypothetical protein